MAKDTVVTLEKENEAARLLALISARVKSKLLPEATDAPLAFCKDLADRYPLLHTVMFAPFFRGGPDEGCTLILWGCEDGITMLCNLKHLRARAFFKAQSVAEALQAIEHALEDPDFKWQRDTRQGGRGKGRGKFSGKPH